jgi:outer membrane protein
MQRTLIVLIALLALTSLGFNIYFSSKGPTLAYVRSHDLISKYAGTIEARAAFEKKKSTMQANVDSLKFLFEKEKQSYINSAASMSNSLRVENENRLNQQHSQLLQYSSAIEEKIEEEDSKMMGAVLGQVNSFVEEYAKENGWDVIMGTTLSGNLLYGNKSLDITDDLLEKLNEKYKGH